MESHMQIWDVLYKCVIWFKLIERETKASCIIYYEKGHMGIGYHTSHFLYTPSHMQRDKSYEIDEKKKKKRDLSQRFFYQ